VRCLHRYITGQDIGTISIRLLVRLIVASRATSRKITSATFSNLSLVERALFLNCGNGWVERDFLRRGVIKSAVGYDCSDELLAEAQRHAIGLPIRYVKADINEADFDQQFDLIVNFAAAHHIVFVDRVFRKVCRHLSADGYFVNYDYVGPHRNQYPFRQWDAVWELNNKLPQAGRQDLRYPHLPTMLFTDPSEAVHSELTIATFKRYFQIDTFKPTGGAIAYPLLTFNAGLSQMAEIEREALIASVLDEDERFLTLYPEDALFAFWFGRPIHERLLEASNLSRWEAEEVEREQLALAAGGRYYQPTLLQTLIYPEAFI
jgi:SAM-dependent methyltransferase